MAERNIAVSGCKFEPARAGFLDDIFWGNVICGNQIIPYLTHNIPKTGS